MSRIWGINSLLILISLSLYTVRPHAYCILSVPPTTVCFFSPVKNFLYFSGNRVHVILQRQGFSSFILLKILIQTNLIGGLFHKNLQKQILWSHNNLTMHKITGLPNNMVHFCFNITHIKWLQFIDVDTFLKTS